MNRLSLIAFATRRVMSGERLKVVPVTHPLPIILKKRAIYLDKRVKTRIVVTS